MKAPAFNLEEQYLSAREIAKRQGISSSTVRRRIARFEGAVFDGFSWRIPVSGYAAYLEDCKRREAGAAPRRSSERRDRC